MPNNDTRIICSSAIPVQADVLIANGNVHFLNDKGSYYNTESSSVGWVEQLKQIPIKILPFKNPHL